LSKRSSIHLYLFASRSRDVAPARGEVAYRVGAKLAQNKHAEETDYSLAETRLAEIACGSLSDTSRGDVRCATISAVAQTNVCPGDFYSEKQRLSLPRTMTLSLSDKDASNLRLPACGVEVV
jgi:hypothetical protein